MSDMHQDEIKQDCKDNRYDDWLNQQPADDLASEFAYMTKEELIKLYKSIYGNDGRDDPNYNPD